MSAANVTVAKAEQLLATLQRLADALVALDARELLETDEQLGQLVASQWPLVPAAEDCAALMSAVRRSRETLLRCRRLGASFGAVARVRLALCSGQTTYNRTGEARPGPRPGRPGGFMKVAV